MTINPKKIEETLKKIEKLDPYWQKIEWIKLRDDDPDLYNAVLDRFRDK